MIAGSTAFLRLPRLYLRSRNFWQTLAAILVTIMLMRWIDIVALDGHEIEQAISLRNQTLALHGLTALLASVILVSVWSPFGEPERTSPGMYRQMRAFHLGSITLIAFSAGVASINSLSGITEPIVDLPWVLIRNTFAYVGVALVAAHWIDCRLAALIALVLVVPSLAIAIAQPHAPLPGWNTPGWNIFAQDQHDIWANLICILLGTIGIGGYIHRGVQDTPDQ